MSEIVASYDYIDAEGKVLYQNVRFAPKTFRQRHSDGNGGWIWGRNGHEPILYRLPELRDAPMQDWVLIAEGEKDVETLRSLGFAATTSGGSETWRSEFAKEFKGRLVAICGDADDAGHRYVQNALRDIMPVAGEVRVLQLPGGIKDISDFIEGRDHLDDQALRGRIHAMIDEAEPVKATPAPESKATAAKGKVPCVATADYVRMADVEAKPIHWLWQDRIPSAMLTLLIGVEGLGKTSSALDMAARVTTGRAWPDAIGPTDAPTMGNVVFLTSEDHLAYTVRPRLDAMGADPAKVFALRGIKTPEADEFFDVTKHLEALEKMVVDVGDVRLIICDPLTAFLGGTDQHKNGEVRTALARFSGLAERHGCAVIGISHLSKDVSKAAIHRTLGSVAFSAAARTVWLIGQDQDNEDRRLLVPVKSNIARMGTSLAFSIVDGTVRYEADQFEINANDLLAGDDGSPIDEAVDFLKGILSDGRVQAKEVKRTARQNQITDRTLARAKKRLKIKSECEGFGPMSVWYWRLPDAD